MRSYYLPTITGREEDIDLALEECDATISYQYPHHAFHGELVIWEQVVWALGIFKKFLTGLPVLLLCFSSISQAAENNPYTDVINQLAASKPAESSWNDILKSYNLEIIDSKSYSLSYLHDFIDDSSTKPLGRTIQKLNYDYNWEIDNEDIGAFFSIIAKRSPFSCFDDNFEIADCDDMDALWDIGRLSLSIEHLAKALELSGVGIDSDSIQHQILIDVIKHGPDIGLITPALTLLEISSFDYAEKMLLDSNEIKQLSLLSLQSLYPDSFNGKGLNSSPQRKMKTPYSLWSSKAFNLLKAFQTIPDDLCPEVRDRMIREQLDKINAFGENASFSNLMSIRHPSLHNSSQLFIPNINLSVDITHSRLEGWHWASSNTNPGNITKGIVSYQAHLLDTSIVFASNYWSIPHEQTKIFPLATQFTDGLLEIMQENFLQGIQADADAQIKSVLYGRSPISLFEMQSSGSSNLSTPYGMCILRCNNSETYKRQFNRTVTSAIKSTGQTIGHTWQPNISSAKKGADVLIKNVKLQKLINTTPKFCYSICDAEQAWVAQQKQYESKMRLIDTGLNRINRRFEDNEKFLANYDANSRERDESHARSQSEHDKRVTVIRNKRDQLLNSDGNDAQPYNSESEKLKTQEEQVEKQRAVEEAAHRQESERRAKEKAQREAENKRIREEKEALEREKREAQVKRDAEEREKAQREREREREERVKRERQRQQEASSKEVPRTNEVKCGHPEYKAPYQKKCVFDGGKWNLITDEAALNAMIFIKYCARVKITEGSQCIVKGGGVVITSPQSFNEYRFRMPKKNACWELKLEEGTTCEVINGFPVIKDIKPDFNALNSIGDGILPYCKRVRTVEGFECRSTDGAIIDITKQSLTLNLPRFTYNNLPTCDREQDLEGLSTTIEQRIKLEMVGDSIFKNNYPVFGK